MHIHHETNIFLLIRKLQTKNLLLTNKLIASCLKVEKISIYFVKKISDK